MNLNTPQKKGKRFEQFIAEEITATGLGQATRERGSGSGFRKGDIAANLPFLLEAKNEKQTNLLPNIDQAKEQAVIGNHDPRKWALITRDPRYDEFDRVYATIDFWEFLTLLKKDSAPRTKEPDRQLKWHLITLKNALNQVIKDLK